MPPLHQLATTLSHSPHDNLTESEIASLWSGVLPKLDDVETVDNERLNVLDPGDSGYPEGPDVREVEIELGNVTHRGDVEIHRHPADWYHHGHHRDKSFNTVVLQVCLDANGDCPPRRQDSQFIPTVSLSDVSQSIRRITREDLDDDYDYRRQRSVKRPCWDPSTPDEWYHTRLKQAAVSWLQWKGARMRRLPVNQRLFQSLVSSLGYTYNHDNFQRLAERIGAERFYDIEQQTDGNLEWEAWLMGKGGWLSRPFERPVNRAIYKRRKIWEQSWSGCQAVTKATQWNRSSVRPQAYPLRRWLQFGWATRGLDGRWYKLFDGLIWSHSDINSVNRFLSDRVDDLIKWPPSSYWKFHYTRSDDRHGQLPRSLGKSWLKQFAVNGLFPWLYIQALESGNSAQRGWVEDQFLSFPKLSGNRRTRRVQDQWGRDSGFDWESGGVQQGAVHLYKHRCTEGKCEGCPFSRDNPSDQSDLFEGKR